MNDTKNTHRAIPAYFLGRRVDVYIERYARQPAQSELPAAA
jgi:hypothetical protein